jgi:hypothetical protein
MPSLSHRETPPRSPTELPDTTSSSAPTPGAPTTSFPVSSAAPLLHRRRSLSLGLRHRGTPRPLALVSPLLSPASKPVRHPVDLLSGHSTATHRPAGFHWQVTGPDGGEDLPCFTSGRKAPWVGLGRPWPNGLGPFQPWLFFFSGINSKFNSN